MIQTNFEHIYSKERISQFLQKHQTSITKDYDQSKINCGIILLNELHIAAQLLREGKLVAFPTETVYGLGANALDNNAVQSIFTTKKRPLTDPVIVHLNNAQKIVDFVQPDQLSCLELGLRFWPGPFTLILKSDPIVLQTSQFLSAGTGYVGFRVPANDTALELLEKSQVPIAAPSANIFSHISPTSPIHVFNDFYDQMVHIIDGESCQAGIESTVVKIDDNTVQILRRGSLSINSLRRQMDTIPQFQQMEIVVKSKIATERESTQAPGQLLKHYSPNIETYILQISGACQEQEQLKCKLREFAVQDTVIIDFNGIAIKYIQNESIIFKCLSDTGDIDEAMHNFYEYLRWAENQQNIKTIFILNILQNDIVAKQDQFETLFDKIYRSASGKYIHYDDKTKGFMV